MIRMVERRKKVHINNSINNLRKAKYTQDDDNTFFCTNSHMILDTFKMNSSDDSLQKRFIHFVH